MARRKIEGYRKKLSQYERRYESFEKFTKAIESKKATPMQENVWMDWEASLNIVKAWNKAMLELGISAAR